MSADHVVPHPPHDRSGLVAWATRYQVSDRLDDVFIGADPRTFFPGRPGEHVTFRDVLVEGASRRRWTGYYWDAEEEARELLHRMATLTARGNAARAWMDEHGRDPTDPVLAEFLAKLREALGQLSLSMVTGAAPARRQRIVGTYEPVGVEVRRDPVPMITYREIWLTHGAHALHEEDDASSLLLLGWNDGPLRWTRTGREGPIEGTVSPERKQGTLEAVIDLIRDPRQAAAQESLGELLRLPEWRFALGALDETLGRLETATTAGTGRRANGVAAPGAAVRPQERVGFRVVVSAQGRMRVEPVIQKRGRNGMFSKGARVDWYKLLDRRDLTAADRAAYRAHEDRFARDRSVRGPMGAGGEPDGNLFGVLRALIDHPAVYLDSDRRAESEPAGDNTFAGIRPDIRLGRLRLQFVTAADGAVIPYFDLAGVRLSPAEAARCLDQQQHAVYLHRPPGQTPQVLLAQLTAPAVALVQTLALTPAQFPPEAHDALAMRLEALQEVVDIEFPSQWTRSIGSADGRLVARLELLASGAVQVRLAVRPVKLGPLFAPGEGPALVLEGQGRDRHGARRDQQMERQQAHALAERLLLSAGEESEPWCWRVGEGDPALHLVATLKEIPEGELVVEWADDERLIALGGVGRGDMRLKVADRHDWFALEGGAAVNSGGQGKGKGKGKAHSAAQAQQAEVVPLADLLAAIREERRYVRVGTHGFVRIEQNLRDALARAEGALFPHGATLQISLGAPDAVVNLMEDEAQMDASAAFTAVRRRMKEGANISPRLSPALRAKLRPYQLSGVEWMARLSHWGAGAILADEMGLGKTIQTLAVLSHRANEGPALVVAPTSVVGNWVDEAARFAPELNLRLYRGAGRDKSLANLGPGDLLVTSYAIATMDAEQLGQQKFGSLVLDEAQAIKNASTERAKALRGLHAAWRVGLTGTPIENHLGELWSLGRVISPGLLGSWEQFRARYAVPIEKFGDEARRKALSALLRPFILRRMKADVARELPPRTEIVKSVSLSEEERALYEQFRLATLEEVATKKQEHKGEDLRFVLLAALTRLRQLCCHPRLVYPRTNAGSTKASYLLQFLAELRDDGHKALVFSQFRSFLELLEPRLAQHGFRVLVLDGTTPAEMRERRIAAFQAGEADVFLISLKAGGFGLNLTAADTVIHLDPWWNPAVEDQATARAHRMGQQRPVTAVRLVAQGTIEEAVLRLHAAKRALASAVLEGSDIAGSLGTDELVDLIRRGATTPSSDPE